MMVSILTRDDLRPLEDKIQALSEKFDVSANLPTSQPFYTNETLAVALGVCERTLQHYRDLGLINYSKVERRIFYTREDVINFLLTHSNAPYEGDSKRKKKKSLLRFNNKTSQA